ncbi:hypothetical protein [Halotia branconii]|uniref:Uncharacterized protein n=1 Tax=Halotia branconii CENA392 TaxID=1539056 RepID=A0AAJ6NSS1_9CYAN|nr:hypothetical protein [Halotia branconii]WGV26059.1 hypothetical protein QI031_00630 [Halotia branconii CENA392]
MTALAPLCWNNFLRAASPSGASGVVPPKSNCREAGEAALRLRGS